MKSVTYQDYLTYSDLCSTNVWILIDISEYIDVFKSHFVQKRHVICSIYLVC